MANDGPTPPHHARQPQRTVLHAVGAAGVMLFALGWLVAGFERSELYGLIRAAACVAAIALLFRLHEIRMERIEARLTRAEYWRTYSDVMADLGGVGSEPTSGAPPGASRR